MAVYSLKKDGTKALAKNFRVREFKCNDGSDKIIIDEALVALLQKIRSHYGRAVKITSAYRTASYNARLKGASQKSQHLLGKAADIKISGISPTALYAYINTLMPASGGLGLYSTFVHVDVRASKSRWDYR